MTESQNNKILYIGGFELPDKNAAAHRVIGIAKSLRQIGCKVVFINTLKQGGSKRKIKNYFGFITVEYKRENQFDYLFSAKTVIGNIKVLKPDIIIAYNYPAVALNRVRRFCQRNNIKCIVDVTEWYDAVTGNIIHRTLKRFDTWFRMEVVQKKSDGVIAISRFLYDFYKDSIRTVLVPPTVDMTDGKWNTEIVKIEKEAIFIYAGTPSATKEKLDIIVIAIEKIAKEYRIRLYIVGITKEEFRRIYSWKNNISNCIIFLGRVNHEVAVKMVKKADWSIILRDNNRVVKAGFPTKLVESISCGTPVITNDFSNIKEYVSDKECLFVNEWDELYSVIKKACKEKRLPNRNIFDYHNFTDDIKFII